MITIEMLPARVPGLRLADVTRWVELAWVRPDGGPGAWAFREIDVARVRLIVELRDELSLDEEALPTVLSLMDQLYEARRQMRAVRHALGRRPRGRARPCCASCRTRDGRRGAEPVGAGGGRAGGTAGAGSGGAEGQSTPAQGAAASAGPGRSAAESGAVPLRRTPASPSLLRP